MKGLIAGLTSVAVVFGVVGEVKANPQLDSFNRSMNRLYNYVESVQELQSRVTCSSFTYWEDAQASYSSALDRDGDGIACESLPRRGTTYQPMQRPYEESPCYLRPDTNIRSGPRSTSNVIGNQATLRNQTVELHSTERVNGSLWSWITADGSGGWVSSELIEGCR